MGREKEKKRIERNDCLVSPPVSYVTWVFAWHMLVTSRDAHVMRRDVVRPKRATKSRAHLQGGGALRIEGEEITASKEEVAKKKKQQGRWSKENEVELRGAHTRGVHTWENGTRPFFFFSSGVAYTWNFSGIYQSPVFDARILRVTSA